MTYKNKIYQSTAEIKIQIDQWKNDGEQLVFTNGCFDLIHLGHINYLWEAKGLGTKLILGINSDQSISRLKGPSRPIKNEENRIAIMASLACIDMVVLFDDDTPIQLIKSINPHILVKGGDWAIDQIVGSQDVIDNGGSVQSLSFIDGYSSTAIIDKIKKSKN